MKVMKKQEAATRLKAATNKKSKPVAAQSKGQALGNKKIKRRVQGTSGSYNGAYNKAYDEAYDKGFNDGYTKGLEDGALDD